MTSLNTAFSGLKAAQAGLYVTGHNMANVQTPGYVRQRALQNTFVSSTVGLNNAGKMQVGLGTDINQINQIRNEWLDISYRSKSSQAGFHATKYEAGMEIQTILGELDSNYRLQSAFDNLWESLQDLFSKPQGLETREDFVSSALIFIDRVNDAYGSLNGYQNDLDLQVREYVSEINSLVSEINSLNGLIQRAEFSGDNANDYRDQRNSALDRLSELIEITYDEMPDGRIDIMTGDHELLVRGTQSELGLRYTGAGHGFVEPVFTSSKDILSWDTKAKSLYTLTGTISAAQKNDTGALKGLLVARGSKPVNYTTNPTPPDPADPQYKEKYLQYQKDLFNVNECMIPNAMKELDALVHKVVTMINDAFAPYTSYAYTTDTDGKFVSYVDKRGNEFSVDKDGKPVYSDGTAVSEDDLVYVHKKHPDAPYDLTKNQSYEEIFVRKNVDRFDQNGVYNEENTDDYFSLYTLGNIILNPIFRGEDGGMNYISTSLTGALEDQTVLKQILDTWSGLDINNSYVKFVTNIAIEAQQAQTNAEAATDVLTEIDAKRSQISGVSLDEEMSNMLRYQHAYNAASRLVNYIDSMLDRIINGTGR